MALFSQPTARALAILDLLMANPTQAFGLTEMTRRLNLNKATCHAILTTMANYGFLVQHPKTKAYRLGPSIIAAGNAAFAQFPVLEYARPELEALQNELAVGFAVTGRSKLHQVLLAMYGNATPLLDSFQLGLRLPNTAPVAACFASFSPARELEAWLSRAHEARGGYDEKLDQKLRVAAIGIRARGYEITLKTRAEEKLTAELNRIHNAWSLDALEAAANQFQYDLCDEFYHLDRVDPKGRYEVSTISVPVFVLKEIPVMCFVAGSIHKPISGAQIEEIAARMQQSADRVTRLATGRGVGRLNASGHAPMEDSPQYRARKARFSKMLTVYGRKPALEALRDPALQCHALHLADNNREGGIIAELQQLAEGRGVPVQRHSRAALARISKNGKQDQGVAVDIACPAFQTLEDFLPRLARERSLRLLALDGISNPANLGMIVRSACAGGIDAILWSARGNAALGPLVVKASAGTLYRAPVVICPELPAALRACGDAGTAICILAADGEASVFDYRPAGNCVFVLGNETEGVSPAVRQLAGTSLSIPMANGVESLNVAVTASLIAYAGDLGRNHLDR